MVNVEVIWNIHSVDKLPRVDIHQHSLQIRCRLHQASLTSPFKCFSVGEISQHTPQLRSFLNILVDVHALESVIKVKWLKLRLRRREILLVVHAVVKLVLEPIEVTVCPSYLKSVRFFLFVVLMFVKFFRYVHSFYIVFKL